MFLPSIHSTSKSHCAIMACSAATTRAPSASPSNGDHLPDGPLANVIGHAGTTHRREGRVRWTFPLDGITSYTLQRSGQNLTYPS